MSKVFFKFCFVIAVLTISHSSFAQLSKLKKSVSDVSNQVSKNSSTSSTSTGNPNAASKNENTTSPTSEGTHYYVRPDGKGKVASKEAPAKDIAAIAMQLKAGDVVHIAAGVYTSKADQSSDVFNVPISIIGGYSPDFNTRDPWGKYKTVMSGSNDISKGLTTERIGILTDKGYKDWT